jgi:tape measure domain-containing protein
MSTVDERVVEMKFNNQQFERGASQTIGTLDRLKGSLRFPSGSEMLGGLESGMRGLASRGLHGIESGVQTLGQRFTGLGVMGVTALATITNQAVMTGERLVKSLTIDPIKQGFQEYNTQLNAVQSILANVAVAGKDIDDVNKVLNELNHYADKTIYNFSEMTKNIGTFTSAGVGLEDSATAIKGIANVAAQAGSTTEQVSGVMYQLSQAISSGKVGLIDWKSVENASMATTTFQRALAQTGVAMGALSPSAVKLNGAMKTVSINGESFRNSISAAGGKDNWLSSKVLLNTLKIFSNDLSAAQIQAMGFSKEMAISLKHQAQVAYDSATVVKSFPQLLGTVRESVGSGWASTWMIIFGDFNQSKKLWTAVSKEVTKITDAMSNNRNKMLGDWEKLGGRTALIQSLANVWEGLTKVFKAVGAAWSQVFPPTSGQGLREITRQFQYFTATLIPSMETINLIYRTAKGFFAALDIGRMIVWEVVKMVARLFGAFGGDGVVSDSPYHCCAMVTGSLLCVTLFKAGDGLQKFFIGTW